MSNTGASILDKETYSEVINNKYNSLKLLTSLVRHDVLNLLSQVSYSKKDMGLTEEAGKQIEGLLGNLRETVSLLSSYEKTEFNFIRVLFPILRSCGVIDNTDCDLSELRLKADIRIFVSILTNIINNSKEAYLRKFPSLSGLQIKITYVDQCLVIEDNAGGFDLSAINYGKTDKTLEQLESSREHNHGFFMKTMIDKSQVFDMTFHVSSIPDGTRVTLGFIND